MGARLVAGKSIRASGRLQETLCLSSEGEKQGQKWDLGAFGVGGKAQAGQAAGSWQVCLESPGEAAGGERWGQNFGGSARTQVPLNTCKLAADRKEVAEGRPGSAWCHHGHNLPHLLPCRLQPKSVGKRFTGAESSGTGWGGAARDTREEERRHRWLPNPRHPFPCRHTRAAPGAAVRRRRHSSRRCPALIPGGGSADLRLSRRLDAPVPLRSWVAAPGETGMAENPGRPGTPPPEGSDVPREGGDEDTAAAGEPQPCVSPEGAAEPPNGSPAGEVPQLSGDAAAGQKPAAAVSPEGSCGTGSGSTGREAETPSGPNAGQQAPAGAAQGSVDGGVPEDEGLPASEPVAAATGMDAPEGSAPARADTEDAAVAPAGTDPEEAAPAGTEPEDAATAPTGTEPEKAEAAPAAPDLEEAVREAAPTETDLEEAVVTTPAGTGSEEPAGTVSEESAATALVGTDPEQAAETDPEEEARKEAPSTTDLEEAEATAATGADHEELLGQADPERRDPEEAAAAAPTVTDPEDAVREAAQAEAVPEEMVRQAAPAATVPEDMVCEAAAVGTVPEEAAAPVGSEVAPEGPGKAELSLPAGGEADGGRRSPNGPGSEDGAEAAGMEQGAAEPAVAEAGSVGAGTGEGGAAGQRSGSPGNEGGEWDAAGRSLNGVRGRAEDEEEETGSRTALEEEDDEEKQEHDISLFVKVGCGGAAGETRVCDPRLLQNPQAAAVMNII